MSLEIRWRIIILLIILMDFFNFITATDKMLNFKLAPSSSNSIQHSPTLSSSSAFRKVTLQDQRQAEPEQSKQSAVSIDRIMEERQRLINQYLQLNIQMLEKEIQNKEKNTSSNSSDQLQSIHKGEEGQLDLQGKQKKIKKINNCGHQDRPHYAKKMCSNCYHRYGRVKKPWRCSHEKLYAAGMCQNCYINDYNKKRREEVKEDTKISLNGQSVQIIEQKAE